ncbi:AI-2E family transporter [Primorskyibacter flagellatus]|uniref:Predicted PurR-regulated permease PerM n=1 Tax=Primorskyibacter flagellatus TaxID=1387277 RepID=A0A1W2CJV0_9RHOB|nr:AI-2E family transporter [Primorskyibacter flagellatus]SMC85493.1 Predicted PurR-regulated permease PerM [Primorskyibacter flagellatus]
MHSNIRQHWQLTILAAVAVIAALYFAKPVFAPFTLAFVFAIVLTPISDFWQRTGLPATASSLMTLFLCVLVIVVLAVLLEPVANGLYEKWPSIRGGMREMVWSLRGLLRDIDDVSREVTGALGSNSTGEAGGDAVDEASKSFPSLTELMFLAPALLGQVMIFLGALYFLLLCRSDVYRWLGKLSTVNSKAAALKFYEADRLVARYSLTITIINVCYAVCVALVFKLIGMPGYIIWGAVAGLLNFVVYLGPALVATAALIAGPAVFTGGMAFVPAAAYVGLNLIEAQFVTPTLVGRQMNVNPLLVFLSLCLFLWLWGPLGGIVAIPLLVWFIAVYDGLATLAEEEAATGTPAI